MISMLINCVDGTITAKKCTVALLITFGIMLIITSSLLWKFYNWLRIRNRSTFPRRRRVGSCQWTARKVYWKQRALSRATYVLEALQRSTEARLCSKKARKEDEGMSTTSGSIMPKMGANTIVGLQADSGADVEDDTMLPKRRYLSNTGRKPLKRRVSTLTERLPFIVSERWKRRVKRKKGFRRRTGKLSQCASAKSSTDSGRVCRVTTISRKKLKKKCRMMAEGGKRKLSVPLLEEDLPPKYHITLKRALEAYRSLRKGRGFHASKRVIWRNRHRLLHGHRNIKKMKDYWEKDVFRMREKEYDVPEPPEEDDDPQWQQTGPQFSSDIAGDGPDHGDAEDSSDYDDLPFCDESSSTDESNWEDTVANDSQSDQENELVNGDNPEYCDLQISDKSSSANGDCPEYCDLQTSDESSAARDYNSEYSEASDSSYDHDNMRKLAKEKLNARRSKESIKSSNEKRSKDSIKSSNEKRSKDSIKNSNLKTNERRSKDSIKNSNLKTNKRRSRKPMPDEYDLKSPYPPTKLQCEGSGQYVSNAAAAFYASQPPPPERTKPFFESMLYRRLFVNLFNLAIGKLSADVSEEETDFISITRILNSAALLNQYSDMLADIGEIDIEDPTFYDTVRERTHDLEPRIVDVVVEEKIQELLQFVDEYKNTYKDGGVCSVEKRVKIIEKMQMAVKIVNVSLDVDAEEFYKMYSEYASLKDRSCKTCTVCGSRQCVEKLNDAALFVETLEVSEDEANVYNEMLYDDDGVEDEIGKFAQKCFHIDNIDGRLYHFLDFDEEEYQKVSEEYDGDNPTQDPLFSLIQSNKLKKLPACDSCFSGLKRRYEWKNKTGNEYDSEYCPLLPKFCFKRRDFGRIPAGMPKLSKLGRTAISPFVAYTRILQLRNAVKDAECGQSSTTGTNFSISTTALKGKEFYIPQTDGEFCGSYKTTLPRDDISHRHRLFFMGNEKDWRLMEQRLNKMNVGLDFDVENCIKWIKLLKRTEAFGSEIELRRIEELNRLASQVREQVSSLSSTDSANGVVLESNDLVSRMADMVGDDVARARSILNDKGVKTDVPGITCSLFNKPDLYGGELPVLHGMLKSINNRLSVQTDRLLLGLEKVLPDEFRNFPKITALSFPDKFPIPVTSDTFMGTSMMNISVRQHLLNYYDGRFCDVDIIFWWYSVLSRHCTIRNVASFFKKNTNARHKFEELCNNEDLQERLVAAVQDNSTPDAKKLNKEFTNLINVVGGYTPWSTTERQKTLGRLYGMANFFGPPSFFFTLSPCIADSDIAIQFLNLPTVRYKLKESTHAQRSTWTANNPVASSRAYHQIVKALVSTFIKIRTGNTKSTDPVDCFDNDAAEGNDNVSLSSMFERHLNSRMGCLGTPTAFYGVHEAQGRGALHMHALVWSLLNAELMERCTQKELEVICRIIDKRIATCISEEDVSIEDTAKQDGTFVRCARRVIPMGLNLDNLWRLGLRTMYCVQSHFKCTFTCFKNKAYWATCRMAKPSALSPITKIFNLIPVKNHLGEHEVPTRSEKIPDPPEEDVLPSKVSNLLWCDHKRISEVDANLVEGNPLISAAFGWNTCLNFMATPGSCQSALYYVANYMRKPIGLLSGILPLVLSSVKKRSRYPSKADDAGDSSREAKYLSSIILNKLNAAQEISDQIAASAVYGYESFLSSHNFAKLYTVDLFKYLKDKGMELSDDATELDDEDKEDINETVDEIEEEHDVSPLDSSGLGQSCHPIKRKLSSEEGGKIVIDMVRDLDDYLYRGPEFADLSPYTYKAIVTKVRKSEINNRSSREFKAGKRPHLVVNFDKDHPQSDTHVQRLRAKFSIIQFIGMQIPNNPGPRPECASQLPSWERKMTKLCNFIEAVYLPWNNVEHGFRPYQEVLAELREFKFGNGDGHGCSKNSYINKHVLRTIGFALNNKGVSSDTKKMIQLVRHQFSRKRGSLSGFLDDTAINDYVEEMELLEVLRDHQLDILGISKGKTSMDLHIEELLDQYKSITTGVKCTAIPCTPTNKVEMSEDAAETLLTKLKKEAEEKSKTEKELIGMYDGEEGSKSECVVDKELFYKGIQWTDDQRRAAEYMLDHLDKTNHNEQLLMLLHGPPGTGKTFLIERLLKVSNLKMRITATSGVAAMSLNGTTIDHFLGRGRSKKKKKKKSTLEVVRTNLGDATLVVVDEVSMLGCAKLLELDAMLQKVKKCSAPFGGVDVILVGDFAQLPPVKQTSLLEAMVGSTLLHTPPTEITLQTTALFSRFVKFDLEEFNRSKGCTLLSSLLTQFRNCVSGIGSFCEKDIKAIGVLDSKSFTEDSKFGDATFLVSTRKEKDAIISLAAKMWAEERSQPIYYWYKRPVSFKGCSEDADDLAESMHQQCFGAKEYYVEGCHATLKHNIAPSIGYANGSKGIVVGLVHKDGYVMPTGAPGERIKIEPPEYVIMLIRKKDGTLSLVPCKRRSTEIEYRRNGKERKYRCYSNLVSLSFAQTIHEVQGQTLSRVILVLGRHVGRKVGRISWSLLYVALSRVKKLEHIKFFPCGRRSSLECFMHLTKLKPSSNFVKWKKGYRNHMWDPSILEEKQVAIEKKIENKLRAEGRDIILRQKRDIIRGYLKGLGYGKLSDLKKGLLQRKLNNHMTRKRLWEPTDENIELPTKRRSVRRSYVVSSSQKKARKRKAPIVELSDEKSEVINVGLTAPQKKKKKVDVQQKQKKKKVINIDPLFQEAMKNEHGYKIREIADDGNCLFRALADQVYGDQEQHVVVRDRACKYMDLHREKFSQFIDTDVIFRDFSHYLKNMRKLKTWGGNLEIIAISELYQRRVEVYAQQTVPRITLSDSVSYDNDFPPIRVTYKNGNHYNSVISDDIAETFLNVHQAGEFEDAVLSSLTY